MLSAKLAAIASMVFAAICLWFALDEFAALGSISDPEEAAGASSFAWFWSFLAIAGFGIAWATWVIAQKQAGD